MKMLVAAVAFVATAAFAGDKTPAAAAEVKTPAVEVKADSKTGTPEMKAPAVPEAKPTETAKTETKTEAKAETQAETKTETKSSKKTSLKSAAKKMEATASDATK